MVIIRRFFGPFCFHGWIFAVLIFSEMEILRISFRGGGFFWEQDILSVLSVCLADEKRPLVQTASF